ncbi:phage tail tape measure protein [Mangrovicoccus algicola]|uniref:Phage tail tape measure protein n=1 Tax=Mangrovicoccus algicola TaxID=2771008 RepID=A0A8J6YTW9_9RHOB|nr:phage tail tape measure protein [Mangrovicoccus algicola]MBE3637462.1 phage tail tape measure protein [Mangrovicoccus algicola]
MSMLNALIGALRVDLGMNSAAFQEGVTNAQRQMRQLEKEFAKIGRRMQGVGQSLSVAVTAPIAGIGATSLRAAGNFEAAMNRIGAVTGASQQQMKQLGEMAQDLGRTTQFSATEAAGAIEMLAKNGLGASDILGGALSASLSLAAASGADLSTAGDIATDVMMQFGKEAGDLGAVVDGISGVLINSKFGIDDYALALAQSGGVAGNVGVSFEDFNAALAATSSLFASGSDAGTSLKTMLQRLVPASGPAAAAMEKLGLEFFDAQGNMKDMREIAQELQDGLAGLSEEAKTDALSTIFGTDAMRSAIGLAQGGAEAIDRLHAAIGRASATEQAEARMAGFNGALRKLASAFEALQLAIANSGLLEFATRMTDRLTGLVSWLSMLDPEILRFGTVIAGVAAAIGPALMAMGALAKGFALAAGGAALIASPVGIAVAAIAGLAAAGAAIVANWDAIAERWPGLASAVSAFGEAFRAAQPFLQGALDVFLQVADWSAGMLADNLRIVAGLLTGDWAAAWDAAARNGTRWQEAYTLATGRVRDVVNELIGDVLDALEGLAADALAAMQEVAANIAAGLMDGLRARWKGVRDGIRGLFSDVTETAEDELEIRSPSRVFKRIGEFLVDGLTAGIRARAPEAEAAVKALAARLAMIGEGAMQGVTGAISSGIASGNIGSIGGGIGSALGSAAQNGFGTILQSGLDAWMTGKNGWAVMTGGLGTSIAGLTTAVSGLSTAMAGGFASGLAGMGAVVSAGLPLVGMAVSAWKIGDALIKGFSSKKLKKAGIGLEVEDGAVDGETYRKYRKSSWWGAKTSTSWKYSDLSQSALAPIQEAVDAVRGGVVAAYEAIGVTASTALVEGFDYASRRISTKGKSDSRIQSAIEDWVEGYADAFSKAIGGLKAAAVEELAAVFTALAPLGQKLTGALEEMSAAAAGLIELAGDRDAFGGLLSGFQAAFYTAQEQWQMAADALAGAFGQLGLVVPGTAREFRDLVNAQDLMTEAGRETYVALLGLSDAFAAVHGDVANATAGLSYDDGWYRSEFDARMAAIAAANGGGILQEAAFGPGGVTYGGAALTAEGNGLMRKLLEIYESWDENGMPPERAF